MLLPIKNSGVYQCYTLLFTINTYLPIFPVDFLYEVREDETLVMNKGGNLLPLQVSSHI